MNKLLVAAALFAMSASVACAAQPSGENTDSSDSHIETGSPASAAKPAATSAASFTPGKYVGDGKMLMIYGACSSQNFLDEAAQGAIDADGRIASPEGDVCGGYKLAATGDGEITVTWDRDPTAHLDAETIAGCKSQEATYYLMAAASYTDPKAGSYAKAGSDLRLEVAAACGTPATLYSDDVDVAVFMSTEDHPAGFLQVEEGDVCGGYTYSAQANGSVKVTWAPPTDASAVKDPTIATGCKSVEGVYTAK